MLSEHDGRLRESLASAHLRVTPVWRTNASRLVSISRDGERLYLNEAFRHAPGPVLDAVAGFAAAALSGCRDREAAAIIRSWSSGTGRKRILEVARRARAARGRGGTKARGAPAVRRCGGTPDQSALLRTLFGALNRDRFSGVLDTTPLVWSYRMTRTLGNCRMVRAAGARRIIDIGMNPSLLLAGNEAQLRDTLVHEMAHAHAWITCGDRGHGPAWKAIAGEAGCDPRSCCKDPLRLRRRAERVHRCPAPHAVLAAA